MTKTNSGRMGCRKLGVLERSDPRVPRPAVERTAYRVRVPWWHGRLLFGTSVRAAMEHEPGTVVPYLVSARCLHRHKSIGTAMRCAEKAAGRWARGEGIQWD